MPNAPSSLPHFTGYLSPNWPSTCHLASCAGIPVASCSTLLHSTRLAAQHSSVLWSYQVAFVISQSIQCQMNCFINFERIQSLHSVPSVARFHSHSCRNYEAHEDKLKYPINDACHKSHVRTPHAPLPLLSLSWLATQWSLWNKPA